MYFARSPEPDFHPEFGFMCPSTGFRRVLRVAVISIAFGATAGAVAVFALAPRADLARDKAFKIIFADEAAAANGAATTGTASSPPPAGADRVQVASHTPAQINPARKAEDAAVADSEEPKVSSKKKKSKVAHPRPRRRDREVADTRDPGAFATPYGSR